MSLLTNFIAACFIAISFVLTGELAQIVLSIGMFALSGAITNWLAVHMLFEKVPLLYGSGVIPRQFAAFKAAIFDLVMEQFFSKEHLSKFLQQATQGEQLDLQSLIKKVDLNPTFDGIIDVIMTSQYGGMLNMIGGAGALETLREPFLDKMHDTIVSITEQEAFKEAIAENLSGGGDHDALIETISTVVKARLDELTPEMVNTLVKKLIKEHLGWLVVWGGVFGGVIGLLMALISIR